jgi:hypothetical protein
VAVVVKTGKAWEIMENEIGNEDIFQGIVRSGNQNIFGRNS